MLRAQWEDGKPSATFHMELKLVRTFVHSEGFVTEPRRDKEDTEEKRHVSSPDTGVWMEQAHASRPGQVGIILGVIVYSDSTHASANGRLQAWPVLISMINIPEALRCAKLKVIYVTDASGQVVKGIPCLFAEVGDYPESSRCTATMQQGSHRPCSSCYIKKTSLADLRTETTVRTVKLHRKVVSWMQNATKKDDADKIRRRWSTHPVQTVLERWNFSETTWGNVFLACVADVLHVLDGGFLGHMVDEFIYPLSKPERRELERWVSRAQEGAEEGHSLHGGPDPGWHFLVQVTGKLRGVREQGHDASDADTHRGQHGRVRAEEKEQRFKEVRAFRRYTVFYKSLLGVSKHTERTLSDVRQNAYMMVDAVQDAFRSQASAWNLPKVHQIIHLIDGIMLRGLPFEYSTNLWEHTHKGTVKVPVRGSNWKDIPRRIVEEEVQREITQEVAALAGGGRQYVSALREVRWPRRLTRMTAWDAEWMTDYDGHAGRCPLFQAVRLQTYVLTRKSRTADVSDGEDAVLWAYKEALGSDMKELGRCLAAAGVTGTAIKVHTAVAIPRTRGGELVAKGTFVKASPSEMWFSDVAVRAKTEKEEWYARCLCVFWATDTEGTEGRYAYVKFYEAAGVCPMTTCVQLTPGRVETRYSVVDVECIKRVVHVCKSYVNKKVMLLNKFLLCE
ncbi:unnamed protein product [Closterium sp. Yama58-4]|nr:unnamed protein product [Closterium sp. Yama58-4]